MTKLSPAQERILKAAAKKPQLDIREQMTHIKNRTVYEKVLQSMIKNGLVIEGDEDGGLIYLISDTALVTVGAKPRQPIPEEQVSEAAAPEQKTEAETTEVEKHKRPARKATAEVEPGEPKVSKQQIIIDLLKRDEGATLKQMMEATGWQRHSLHGAMAGGLKKKFGFKITSTKESGGETIYKIA